MYFSNFYDVIIGSTNNPIVRHVTGTYTPDNILNSLTINGSSVLDLATSQWIRDAAGGSFTMNGTSKMILGNYLVTAHWFKERGFSKRRVDDLPAERRLVYNLQRRSSVLMKEL